VSETILYILYQLLAACYLFPHSARVLLELDVALPFDKGSVPWHVSFSIRKLTEELGVRITVKLHALQAAVGVALIGIEEAVRRISLRPSSSSHS
jgi:hypothetical protein